MCGAAFYSAGRGKSKNPRGGAGRRWKSAGQFGAKKRANQPIQKFYKSAKNIILHEVQHPPIEKPALCLSFSHVPPWPTWNIFTHYCWIRFSKIQENSIFTGKMERPNRWWNMSAEPWDLSEFFPISIVAVGVTFIKIIWRFVQNGPNWSLLAPQVL